MVTYAVVTSICDAGKESTSTSLETMRPHTELESHQDLYYLGRSVKRIGDNILQNCPTQNIRRDDSEFFLFYFKKYIHGFKKLKDSYITSCLLDLDSKDLLTEAVNKNLLQLSELISMGQSIQRLVDRL